MEKVKFYQVINKLILPLFTGSSLVGEETSSSRDSEVAIGKQKSLFIKANKNDEYRVVIKRSRAFQQFEVNLLRYVLKELNDIDEMQIQDSNYEQIMQIKAIEKAVCESLSQNTTTTMLGIITELENWSNRTYEGKKPTFGVIINQQENEQEVTSSLHYTKIMSKNFVALLSDGKSSFIELDKDGYLMGYLALSNVRKYTTIAPNDFENVARYCNEKRIGIVLTESGDLLVFKNRQLLFAKRRGVWNVYCHEEVIQLLSYKASHSQRDIRSAIYLTALDCLFAYNGGVIIYLNKDEKEKALATINAKDLLSEDYYEVKKGLEFEESSKLYNLPYSSSMMEEFNCSYEEYIEKNDCVKANCLRKFIEGKKFQDLSRKLREELVSMDGATVIDFDGTIIAIGAILKIEAGSNEGGRLAAATNLAKYGVSIKISQDGQMQGFCPDKRAPNGIKALFTVN